MPWRRALSRRLTLIYGWYAFGLVLFIVALGLLERAGLPRAWIGYAFLVGTIGLYAIIGIISRTADVAEYYVAGRRVPALFNGMATAADWMSAATFIAMAGSLYAQGFGGSATAPGGLAYILGWTGGYCLVALLLAPYLRKFGQYTIPDFFGARYEGHAARLLAAGAAIMCSFTYLVAQIFGVGLITTQLTGVPFELGMFLGLGGVLVCSFLGGMKAVTWTQVAQYIILIIAYLLPVVWLSVKHTGTPVPQLAYGRVLEKVGAREEMLTRDPREIEVRRLWQQRAQDDRERIAQLPQSQELEHARLQSRREELRAADAPISEIQAADRALKNFPRDAEGARALWARDAARVGPRAAPPLKTAEAFPGADEAERSRARNNFLALMFCLMMGTAGLPHVLMRYYTTPSVGEARESVFWSLFFIFLLYCTAPALAVLVKYDIYTHLVGSEYAHLPAWVAQWSHMDGGSLLSINDINHDKVVQLAEISINPDIIVLATPEIAGLPYVVSGLVAAGGLAAALSTADGLLLTISNALSHDFYYRVVHPEASSERRVTISKILLMVVALTAAYVASRKIADILDLVSTAFSLAASAFFPALVLGIFWKRANKWGACAGMLAGAGVTLFYMASTQPWLRSVFHVAGPAQLWWDIQPISAGVFGVPMGFAVIILVSWLTPAPGAAAVRLVEMIRTPESEPAAPDKDAPAMLK
ncbi:MAG TPA: VC_2705 family sodium/solute symporter [Burkholderiales bacterium]|nr:VC_2705 family sodium/solute symporter [Burkholderiales bacterium]